MICNLKTHTFFMNNADQVKPQPQPQVQVQNQTNPNPNLGLGTSLYDLVGDGSIGNEKLYRVNIYFDILDRL